MKSQRACNIKYNINMIRFTIKGVNDKLETSLTMHEHPSLNLSLKVQAEAPAWTFSLGPINWSPFLAYNSEAQRNTTG